MPSIARTRPRARAAAAALALSALARPGPAAALDAQLWAQLLERHSAAVPDTAGTRVDYAGLRASADWRRLVESLARRDPAALATRAARLAFWINAYNVLAIETVVRAYPIDSIRDAGSFLRPVWVREAGRVGGRAVTLDEIEHRILRPLGEPRVHAAIVCASVSCPSLRREPYAAERLESQLDDALRRWLADPRKGARLDRAAGSLTLSRVFDWFAEDFEPGVLAFLLPYFPDADRAWLAGRMNTVKLRYFEYDWSLNDLARRRPRSSLRRAGRSPDV